MSSPPSAAAIEAAKAALELAVGPLLVTLCVAFILYGVFTAQLYYYYNTYTNDGVWLQSFVGIIGVLETIHTAMCMHILYDYFVAHFGDPAGGINLIIWSVPITVVLEMLIVTLTSLFYVRRIWVLSGKSIIAISLPVLLLIARNGVSVVTMTLLYKYPRWDIFEANKIANKVIEATFAVGLAADVAITTILIWFLGWKQTSFAGTNHKLQRLIHYTASTGALTVILSAAILGTVKLNGSLLFGGLVECLSKVVANSMLAMLNARNRLRREGENRSNAYEFSTSIRTGTRSAHEPPIRFAPGESVGYTINEPTKPNVPDYTREALGDYKASVGRSTQSLDGV